MTTNKKFLIAEYCGGPFYMGWHLYLRDTSQEATENADGDWGWITHPDRKGSAVEDLFKKLGLTFTDDGTTKTGPIAEFAKRYPMESSTEIQQSGCLEVIVDEYGKAHLLPTA
jgi:hypothetical protein